MKKTRILVTGSGGMVGSYAEEIFADYELVLTDLEGAQRSLDIRHPADMVRCAQETRPDLILHLAAATDVDRCEEEPDWAYHSNAVGTQNVALACQKFNIPLVYISTAGVFDGNKEALYTEFDEAHPANIYGHSKLAGERIVQSLLSRYYIVRAGWMIGGGKKDKKFVGKIFQLISQGKTPLKVVNDKWGTPTYAKHLLRGIHALIKTGYYGLYHMANRGKVSRYDIAVAIREILERPEIEILPVSSDAFPLPAPRARSEAMRDFKLETLGIFTMPTWRDALKEYIENELVSEPALSSGKV